MSVVSMKQLLEAGVHFGHQTRRWNPKMAEYIFTERNGIYIIDLQKTVKKLEEAYKVIKEVSENGGEVLFVGTKKQAQSSVKEEAERCGMPFVNARWLGGMLTNFATIKQRIKRLAQLKAMKEDGTFELLPKKEVAKYELEIEKLEKYIGGITEMKKQPAAMFIVDPRKEKIAVAEAKKLGIPVIAIVDTNCDPDDVKNLAQKTTLLNSHQHQRLHSQVQVFQQSLHQITMLMKLRRDLISRQSAMISLISFVMLSTLRMLMVLKLRCQSTLKLWHLNLTLCSKSLKVKSLL